MKTKQNDLRSAGVRPNSNPAPSKQKPEKKNQRTLESQQPETAYDASVEEFLADLRASVEDVKEGRTVTSAEWRARKNG